MIKEYQIYTEGSAADPAHVVVVAERKKNDDVVGYEDFTALEAVIAGVKYAKAYNAGFNDGQREQYTTGFQAQIEAYRYASGYEEGFDKGVHMVLETLGITDAEFSSVDQRERLKKTVTFYRGLVHLGMDLNTLKFYNDSEADYRFGAEEVREQQET